MGERCGWTCGREFHHRPDGRRCHGHGPERTGGTPAFCTAIPRRGLGGARTASGDPSSVSHPQRLAVLVDPSTTLTTKSKGLGYRCPGESPGKSPRQRRRFPRLKSHVPQSCSQIRSRVPWTSRTDPADAAKRAAASALTNVEGAPEAYCYVSRVQSQSSLPQPLCSFLLLTTLMNIQPAGPGPI